MDQKWETNKHVKRMLNLGYAVICDNPLWLCKKVDNYCYHFGQIDGDDEDKWRIKTGCVDVEKLKAEDINEAISLYYDSIDSLLSSYYQHRDIWGKGLEQIIAECAFEQNLFLTDEIFAVLASLESAQKSLAALLSGFTGVMAPAISDIPEATEDEAEQTDEVPEPAERTEEGPVDNGAVHYTESANVPELVKFSDGLVVGKIEQVAREIALRLVDDNGKTTESSLKNFKDLEFALVFDDEIHNHDMLWDVFNGSGTELYGLKSFDPKFESNYLYLVSDIFGGGAPAFGTILEGTSTKDCERTISRMIKVSANYWTYIVTDLSPLFH